MRTQLIQKKAQIGSQVELTLTTGNQISGLLTEIGLEHITLDGARGEMTILVESIIAVQSLDNIDTFQSSSDTSDLDNQVNISDSSNSKPNKIEVPDSANLFSSEIEVSEDIDANTESEDSVKKRAETSEDAEESSGLVPEEGVASEDIDANTESEDSVKKRAETSEDAEESSGLVPEEGVASEDIDANTESEDSVKKRAETSEDAEESSGLVPEEGVASEDIDANTESEDSVDFEEQASEKLVEIENRFNVETQIAKLELRHPDLTFPAEELTGWQNTDVYAKWVQIKNKYDYAQKTDEFSVKFGRIQPIVAELKFLTKRFPNSSALKRVIAYFYSILDSWDEALHNYQKSAIQSGEIDDWFDVAVSALRLDKKELACYSLQKFFYGGSISNEPKTWCVYVDLLDRFNNLPAFRELCKTDEYGIAEEAIEILLDTASYLLKKRSFEALAIEIIQKRIKGESAKPLLEEAVQELDSQPTESYRQFLAKFMNDMITEEKPRPLTAKHANTAKQSIRTAPRKQSLEVQIWPDGEDLYKEAERADKIEKNLEKAEHLYQECIRRNIRHDSAIMDLAMVYVQLNLPNEAVTLLEGNRDKVKHTQRLDNLLATTVYPKAGKYEEVIELLNKTLKYGQNKEKRWQIFWQIANSYIRLRDYKSAENQFHQALKLRPDNIAMRRSLAFCFSQQKRYDKAEEILNRIQNTSPNPKTAELLEAIDEAKTTGEFTLDDDSFIPGPSDFSDELSEFTQFFLARCTFEGLRADRVAKRVRDGKYIGSEKDVKSDIERLANIAKELGPSSPRERSNYNLSAAKIYFDVKDNRESFYRYLCRSFASRGDAAVIENRDLDAVREWYCEALTVYDGARGHRKDDDGSGSLVNDADGSLVRYLYSTLGADRIPRPPKIPSISGAITEVIRDHSEGEKAFDAIAYLVSHSGYATNRILECLYTSSSLRKMALDYLKKMSIVPPHSVKRKSDFIQLWHELRRNQFSKARTISNDLRVLQTFELSAAWLEDNIRRIENIRSNLFFELDKQRVTELGKILDTALELCKQRAFGEREHRCKLLDGYCEDLLNHITENPTKLSVKDIHPIINVIQGEAKKHLEGLYETSKPQLTLRLAEGKESYVPVNRRIEVQIVVENEEGRMPADALKLVTQADKAFFQGAVPDIELAESLRGGKETQATLKVPLYLTDEALQSEAFSLPVYAEYGIRGGKRDRTPVENLSIRLYSEDKFEKIENPYATYAEGGIVGDANMFFGREELIKNIAQAIQGSRAQSKCVLVFGQKRSGKSSVLHHLKTLLLADKELLILDLKDIGSIQDPDSKVPLLYQILRRILTELEYAVADRINDGLSQLDILIPDDEEFYQHPAPLQYFQDTFVTLKRLFSQHKDWNNVKCVLLIDEFQYIYDRIIAGKIPESFMQNWKALLQANYFSAVLVGQDVMPKFKLRFPNEFGTTQDERVTYLNELDAIKLIEEPIRINDRQDGIRYRERAVPRILDLTAGSPFYIQIICNRLVEYMNVKRAELVTDADVEQVTDELVRGVNALGPDKFDNLINSGDTSADRIKDEDALKVLKDIADNSSKTDFCHRDRIGCKTNVPVDTILGDLEKRDVVKRREQSYQIQVGLFKEWLMVNG